MPLPFDHPPRFERRGLMLDISRNRVPTMIWLKRLIDALALLRYNELQLYFEHTFAYAAHQTVWEHASPMTAKQIREIDRYCGERGIELVPNQNSFGHMERWLRHRVYAPLAECPDGFEHPVSGWRQFGSTLYPGPESAAFVDALYDELLPNFQSTCLHIGCDEPWELGKGRSKERVTRSGKHAVYLDFLQELFARAHKHGHQAQFWADIILERPDLVPQLPGSVTPVIWGYEADAPLFEQCRIVAEAGFKGNFYVAPGAANWNSFGGRLHVAKANIELAAEAGTAYGARGFLLTAWGDNGHHQPWPTLFPALVFAAHITHGHCLSDDALAEQIDQTFYPEQPPGHGHAICQLGQIDARLPQPGPPNSFLHSAFFATKAKLPELLQLTNSGALQVTLTALNTIDATGLDPEIQLGIDLNRSALERCLQRPKTHAPGNLKSRFASLWLHRSREGGLAESLEWMPPSASRLK